MANNQLLDCDYESRIEDGTVEHLAKHFGLPDLDIDCGKTTCYVEWELQPEARSWGIKSISVFATKVTASVEWEIYTDDLTEEEKAKLIANGGTEYRNGTIGGTIEVVSNQDYKGKKWEIESEIEIQEGGMICPDNVQIDFDDMSIIVS